VPENPSVAKEVGYAASRLGKHDIALQGMGKAAKHNPNDAALYCNLGLSCLLAGKATDACLAFERTVQLEPERNTNKQLLAFAREVESGKRPIPKTEEEISKAI
jgi:Flp pilus assembly protein TadD